MKKGIFIKVKVLPQNEYRRLARILKLRFGGDLNSAKAIFYALEYGCNKIDSNFSFQIKDTGFAGVYNASTHTVYLSPETYDKAWKGDLNSLFTIVHEISHWALITLFGIKPKYIVFELPLILSSVTDAELYADTFSCYLIISNKIASGGRKSMASLKRIFRHKKNGGIIKMSLVILKNRRCYRAVGYKKTGELYNAKKTA